MQEKSTLGLGWQQNTDSNADGMVHQMRGSHMAEEVLVQHKSFISRRTMRLAVVTYYSPITSSKDSVLFFDLADQVLLHSMTNDNDGKAWCA